MYIKVLQLKNLQCSSLLLIGKLLMIISFLPSNANSQSMGISNTTITPDVSSILEMRTTTKGLLIPRMITAERDAIGSPATGLMIFNTETNQFNYYTGSAWTSFLSLGTAVNSITGTLDRIVVSGSSENPVINISTGYTGQTSITTLGTIGAGTWNGSVINPTYGGTGVDNGSKTITLDGNLITSGAYSTTLNSVGTTNISLPVSGTLSTLNGVEILTNKTINSPVINSPSGLVKADVGLSNLDNTSDLNKPISTATQTALNLKINLADKGVSNGVASLDGGGKVPLNQMAVGAQLYKGTWNAATNSPALSDATGVAGDTYRVTTGGTVNLGSGNVTFGTNDDAIHNGTIWQRNPASNAVTSVNGFSGTVVLSSDNVTEGSTNKYYTDTRAALKIDVSQKGTNNGVASLDAGGKVPIAQLPVGTQTYKGTWNASTNTPTLSDATGSNGWTYRVTTAGTQNLGSGSIAFSVGDDVIHNGTIWERSPSSATVTSVNSQTGNVVLNSDNIAEGASNLYFTDTRARSILSANAPLAYNSGAGIFSISQATSSAAGYLSATDWVTFNQKQNAGNYLLDPGNDGIIVRTALNNTTIRTITGTSNRLDVTNGNGIGGNPTLDISTNYVGQNTITTLGTITTGTWNGTTIAANRGGTGMTSYTTGDLLYATSGTTLGKLPGVAIGNALISGGVAGAPSWGKIGLTSHVSGILPIANGGTNSTATPTSGGVAYGNGSSYQFTAAGTSGQVLISSGSGAPAWANASMMLAGNTNKKEVSNTTKYFPVIGCRDDEGTDIPGVTRNVVSRSGTIRNLYVSILDALVSGKTGNITILKNGVATSLVATCSVGANSANNTSNSFTVVAGDEIGIQINTTGKITCSWAIDFNY